MSISPHAHLSMRQQNCRGRTSLMIMCKYSSIYNFSGC